MNVIKLDANNHLPVYSHQTFIGDDVISQVANHGIFRKCIFQDAHVNALRIQSLIAMDCTFSNVTYQDCSITLSCFSFSQFEQCKFINSDLPYTGFNNTQWNDSAFIECILSYSRFLNSLFNTVEFNDCDIYEVLFNTGSNILKEKIKFICCNIEEAYFNVN